jgi:predicted transcriptional regulator
MEETVESIQNKIRKLQIEAHELVMSRSTEITHRKEYVKIVNNKEVIKYKDVIELVLSPQEVKALNILNKEAEGLFLKKEELHKQVEEKIEFNKDLLKQQKRVLMLLLEYPDGLSGQEIGTKLELYRARVYEILLNLRGYGLIFAKQTKHHAKRQHYIISALGIRTMNNIEPK